MLKLKFQYFSQLTGKPDLVEKISMLGKYNSVTQSCLTLTTTWTHARQPCPSPTPSLFKLVSIELVMPSNHLILCHPLLLLPSIFPNIRVSSNDSVLLIWWPKYWRLASASILPMNSQDWFALIWAGWICLQFKGLSRVFSNIRV